MREGLQDLALGERVARRRPRRWRRGSRCSRRCTAWRRRRAARRSTCSTGSSARAYMNTHTGRMLRVAIAQNGIFLRAFAAATTGMSGFGGRRPVPAALCGRLRRRRRRGGAPSWPASWWRASRPTAPTRPPAHRWPSPSRPGSASADARGSPSRRANDRRHRRRRIGICGTHRVRSSRDGCRSLVHDRTSTWGRPAVRVLDRTISGCRGQTEPVATASSDIPSRNVLLRDRTTTISCSVSRVRTRKGRPSVQLAIDVLKWPGVNVAFLFSFLLTTALSLVVIPYAKRRPKGTPTSWGEAMLAVDVRVLRACSSRSASSRTSGSTTPTRTSAGRKAKIVYGPFDLLKPKALGGWFPFTHPLRGDPRHRRRGHPRLLLRPDDLPVVRSGRSVARPRSKDVATSTYGRPLVKKA